MARFFRMTTAALAVLTCPPAGAQEPVAPAPAHETAGVQADPDGTLRISSFFLPPSDFWSPQFKAAYIKRARAVLAAKPSETPSVADRSPAWWDAFDKSCKDRQVDELAWQKQNYPVRIRETAIHGVNVAFVSPEGAMPPTNRKRVLIQLRGGSCGGLVGLTEAIPVAHFGRIPVVVVSYRPAPRHPYPASVDDVVTVYRELLKTYHASSIGIFGTSGGGMLTTEAVPAIKARGLPQPGAVGVFWSGIMSHPYPFGKWGDSFAWSVSGVPQTNRALMSSQMVDTATYLKGVPSTDPIAYPGTSDTALRSFPPTLFVSGTRANDFSAVVTSHARMLKLGVDSSLYVMEGGWHGSSFGTRSPEEADVNTYIGRWFTSHLR